MSTSIDGRLHPSNVDALGVNRPIDTTRASLTATWAVCSHPSVVDWPFKHAIGGRFGNASHCSSI